MISRITSSKNFYLLLAISGIVIFSGLFIYKFQGTLLPMLWLPGVFFLLLFLWTFYFEKLLWGTVFFIPLSINLADIGKGFGISLPLEILLVVIGATSLIRLLKKSWIKKEELFHPVSIVIFLQTAWIFVGIFFSGNSMISAKFLISRGLYLLVFYFFFLSYFRKISAIIDFIRLYFLGFLPVIILAGYYMITTGLSRSFSPVLARPFFSDHTIFAACLCLIFPGVAMLSIHRKRFLPSSLFSLIFIPAPFIILFGIYFSFSRASWLGVILIFFVWLMLKIKIKFPAFLGIACFLSFAIFIFRGQLTDKLQPDSQIGEETVFGNIQSVTDIESNESNLERINRWNCAIEMYKESPILGYGPGTYEIFYPVFQITSDMTRISTWKGDLGDAHSEYLSALSEQGIPGLIILIFLYLILIKTAMKIYYENPGGPSGKLAMGILLGMFTYFLHGGVNSFIDIDKLASLFWAMAGMLTALDLYHQKTDFPFQNPHD